MHMFCVDCNTSNIDSLVVYLKLNVEKILGNAIVIRIERQVSVLHGILEEFKVVWGWQIIKINEVKRDVGSARINRIISNINWRGER